MFLIVMRLGDPGNFSVNGDCNIPGYEKWITLDSVSFGVGKNVEVKAGGADGKGFDVQSLAPTGEMQSLSIDKSIDCSSIYIMHKSIQDRASGSEKAQTSAVIHFVENLPNHDKAGKDGTSSFPFLKIKLGNVLIKSWSLSASGGGDRPSESIELWFSQIAMAYRAIKDGKTLEIVKYGPKGWDQFEQKEWPSSGSWADKE